MKLKLHGNILLDKKEKSIIIESEKIIKLTNQSNPDLLNFIYHLSKGVLKKDIDFNDKFISQLISFNLLREYNNEYIGTALEKSYDFLWNFNKQSLMSSIKNLNIIIFGCGGLGANIAQNLLLSGFSKFHLIDSDKVEFSNLNRQLPYTKSDVGKYKVEALKNALLNNFGLNPQITTSISKIESSSQKLNFSNPDFIICAIDDPPIESAINVLNLISHIDVPIIFGGVGYNELKIGPLLNNSVSKEKYIEKQKYMKYKSCKAITGSVPSTNNMLSSIVSNEIFNYFTDVCPISYLNKEKYICSSSLKIKMENKYD